MLRLHNTLPEQCCHAANAYVMLTCFQANFVRFAQAMGVCKTVGVPLPLVPAV
jgi:hypothetical protein